MKRLISLLCHILLLRPFLTLAVLVLVLGISVQQSLKLNINSNQIDLLPEDGIEVIKTKEVIEMIGGNGFYIVALKIIDEKNRDKHIIAAANAKEKGNLDLFKSEMAEAEKIKQENLEYYTKNERKIKRYADKLNSELIKDKDIRYISYKFDTTFLKDRLPLYIKSNDMREVRSRIKKKIDSEIDKLNPFDISLTEREDYNPTFDDILSKYQRLAKRDVFDSYNIAPDKGMLLLLVKPDGSFLNLDFTRNLETKIKKIVADLKLEDKGIHAAYSGSYKLNLDDYDSLVDALKPISIASLVGIIILLFIFFRNPIFILVLVISLLTGIAITFGITGFAIGRLNTVTTILAAVLMGLGIDYGIQFLYRFREEFTLRDDFMTSVTETIFHTGIASLMSALTTSSAFFVLCFSDFRGFSEFGLIALYGIIIIGFSMYFITALQIAILFRISPSIKRFFYLNIRESEESSFAHKFFSNPKRVLIISGTVILIIFAFIRIEFNYSGRDLLLENQESLLIYDEIGDRFDVSSDPQAIVTDTLEKSEAVFDFFTPVPDRMKDSVDQVVSIWNIIPPENQQKENLHILKQIKDDLKFMKPEMLKEEHMQYLPTVEKYLAAKDFTYNDVPEFFKTQFKEVPSSKIKGHMIFIYPKVALWHGKDLLNFYDNVGKFEYPLISKRTLNAILYSTDINLDEHSEDHALGKYTPEEEITILKISNSSTKEDLEKMTVLPLTAQLIVDKRPFKSIEEMRNLKDTAYTAGSVILFAKLATIVTTEAPLAVGFTLFIVLAILITFYRGLLPAILSLFPLIIGLLVMLGIMGIFGAKINFINVLVFPIVIGYGIQNGIYIYYRFMEEQNVGRTLSKVGPAVIASTLTTLVGWGVLLIAEHRGLHSVGVSASIGIASSLLVALTLLPSLLAIVYSPKKEEATDLSIGLNINTSIDDPDTEISESDTIDLDSEKSVTEEKLEINLRNVSTNYKEDLQEKLKTQKEDTPIDLDKEEETEVDSVEAITPSSIDLHVKEDIKEKLESSRKKKPASKKSTSKTKEKKKQTDKVTAKKKPAKKKTSTAKKKNDSTSL